MERGRSTRPYPRSVRLLADALGLPEQARARLLTAAGADRHSRPAIQPEALERAGRAGVPAPPPMAVPRQVPAGVAHFSGRVAELRALDRLLSEEGQPPGAVVISAIGGTAGIGKTALALHWAQLIAHLFPDGQLYASLRGFDPSGAPVAPGEVIRGFLAALGVRPERVPATMDDQVGLYRTLLAQRRVLVVLDNARDAEQVRPLLPTSPTCLAVVTSRSDLAGLVATAGARPLILDVPSSAEARQLLAGVLGPARVAGEAAAAAALVRLCARLPLALAIVGARGAAAPGLRLAALAAGLGDAEGRLDVLETGDPLSSVRAVFSWSCRYLSDPAARLFRLTGVHPGPDITAQAAASLAGIGVPAARRALAELTRSHLLSEHSPGRFAFHDLLRVYAAEQARDLDDEAARQAAGRRVLDHYLHTAHAGALLLRPLRARIVPDPPQPGCTPEALGSSEQALAWFEAERHVLLTLTAHAAATGLDRYAWQIPWTLTDFLDRRGHWQDMVSALQTARAAAERLEDLDAQARTCHSLGRALLRTSSAADAETQYRRALVLAGQVGDLVGMASAHIGLTPGMRPAGQPARRAHQLRAGPGPLPFRRAPGRPGQRTQRHRLVSCQAGQQPAGACRLPRVHHADARGQ